jgi:hypothetical protein
MACSTAADTILRSAGSRLGRAVSLSRTGRAGKRWTPAEDRLLESLCGRIPTAVIARRLARSSRAVQHRLQHLRVSPHDAHGDYTAAELARIFKLPPSTIVEWCRKGWIPARKVGSGAGGVWRIEWDGLTAILPRWTCQVCGRSLGHPRGRWCSSRCKWIGYGRPRRQAAA